MRIQNNITAMNTHRQYTINNDNVAKSAEKLSSGYRINRAGDDAAGLAISEKMRSQIRGLNMATKNSQDAISLVQTAEGALQETHSMLQRMNELAVQAATGTNQETDRLALAKEFEQLKREINDVAESTTFNNMKILDGSISYKGYERSAATAGVTVTRPTPLEGATGGSEATGSKVLGATATAKAADIGMNQTKAGTNVADGKTVTVTASYKTADGEDKKIEFTAKNTTGSNATVKDLLNAVDPVDGWSVEMADDGSITLTNVGDPGLTQDAKVSLALTTSDATAATALGTVEGEASVALAKVGDPVAGTNTKIEIDASTLTFSGTGASATLDIDGTQATVTLTASAASNNQNMSAVAGNGNTVSATLDATTAANWDVEVDTANNKIILTAKNAPADGEASPVVDNVAKASGGTGAGPTSATVIDAVPASTMADPAAQATKPTIEGLSIGATNAALAGTAQDDTATLTVTDEKGNEIKFTAQDTNANGGAKVSDLFKNGVKSEDGNWKATVDATTGDVTLEYLGEAGKTDFGSAAKVALDMSDATAKAGIRDGDYVDGTITNGADGAAKTESASASGVTTIEYGFDKLRAGDEVTVKIGDSDVKVQKTGNDTRESFIQKLQAAVTAAGFSEDQVAVSGTAIVVKDNTLEVGTPSLSVDSLSADQLSAEDKPTAMRIQVGALEHEQLNLSIDSMNTKGLGLDDINLDDQDSAGKAITAVRNAVLKVADQRATLGAMQNRLDHKIANLKVTSENLSAAESRIRDVDMASEMTNFTKNNILSQAATAMLAQANALPQNVLSLLG